MIEPSDGGAARMSGQKPVDKEPMHEDPSERSSECSWAPVPGMFRTGRHPLPAPWEAIFGPLRRGNADDLVVLGQLGQSLDGRIATSSGHSKYINGAAGLDHLHRIRALVDGIVVGIGTALADDPQLTVRRVSGPNPARIVIDPRGRLPRTARLLEPGVRRIVVTAAPPEPPYPPGVEVLTLPLDNGRFAPPAILRALAATGFRRLLIEGGAQTVSHFLSAGCLDRLHVVVAPIILGSGRPSLVLEPIERADQAMRPTATAYPIGEEVLFDCDLSPQRVPVVRANTSL
jgi:diaminohydroxyphosphoribosylaminopyrimidine deaminase / 5-amino-6-(5-phosphoribosylamino)uracil reductase